jgi:uncharacterized protein (DUF362 family)
MTGIAFGRPNFVFHDTHWAVCLAAAKVFKAMGAVEIKLIEGINESATGATGQASFDAGSYPTALMASEAGCVFENTRNHGTYTGYALKTPESGLTTYMYDSMLLNKAWTDPDTVYVTIPKLKNHQTAGITLGMKNLMGMPANSYYGNRDNPQSNTYQEWNNKARSDAMHLGLWDKNYGYSPPGERPESVHGQTTFNHRLPRVICDENMIRPMHLTIIDAILGQATRIVPNDRTPVTSPGVLIAGLNTVCTDSVGAAVMGYNPDADHFTEPFLNIDNHLRLAADAGLGTNRLSEIDVLGEPIRNVRFSFIPKEYEE